MTQNLILSPLKNGSLHPWTFLTFLGRHASGATCQAPSFIPHCHSLPPCLKMVVLPPASLTLKVFFILQPCTFSSSQTQTYAPFFSHIILVDLHLQTPQPFFPTCFILYLLLPALIRVVSLCKDGVVRNCCLTNKEGSYCLPAASQQLPVCMPSSCGMYEVVYVSFINIRMVACTGGDLFYSRRDGKISHSCVECFWLILNSKQEREKAEVDRLPISHAAGCCWPWAVHIQNLFIASHCFTQPSSLNLPVKPQINSGPDFQSVLEGIIFYF